MTSALIFDLDGTLIDTAPDLLGALMYMNLAPGEIGDDAHGYAWVEAFRQQKQAAE